MLYQAIWGNKWNAGRFRCLCQPLSIHIEAQNVWAWESLTTCSLCHAQHCFSA